MDLSDRSGRRPSVQPTQESNEGEDKTPARPMGRTLYVMPSFDRGERTEKSFTGNLDKMGFILRMVGEMRERCEVRWGRLSVAQ